MGGISSNDHSLKEVSMIRTSMDREKEGGQLGFAIVKLDGIFSLFISNTIQT